MRIHEALAELRRNAHLHDNPTALLEWCDYVEGLGIDLPANGTGVIVDESGRVLSEWLFDDHDGTHLEGPNELVAIRYREAADFVNAHHSHHKAPQGWQFGVGVQRSGVLVGVAMAGRPVSRHLDDGHTIEITRVCVRISRNAASMLLAAIVRAAKALGYRRVITYTLDDEEAASVMAAGFTEATRTVGGSWDRPGRPRADAAPTSPKRRFERRIQ